MASDTPDIDPGDDGGIDVPAEAVVAGVAAAGAAIACLSCGAKIVGPYCSSCGQKNDDMRRSLVRLFVDFIEDTFAFDSRMWRTLGLMAAAPGKVPTNYSHGRRSRYTPPVRLFLVVSFLFFLVLGLTHTMFVAVEVRAKTPAEIEAERVAREKNLAFLDDEERRAIEIGRERAAQEGAVVIDGAKIDCDIKVTTRFFVRPQDIQVDEDKWRACSTSIQDAAKVEIETKGPATEGGDGEGPVSVEDVQTGFNRVLAGIDLLIANPAQFNEQMNVWLPRILFLMAPVLALILGVFIRGRDALLFDHLVLSLYSHATAFAIFGVAILLGQFGVPNVFPTAMAALGLYFTLALKRAYGRGWVKTVYSTAFAGLIYTLILVSVVGSIIANQIWRAAA